MTPYELKLSRESRQKIDYKKREINRTYKHYRIKLGDCAIDREAQREATSQAVKALADRFDPDLMGTITVSHRDGTYWILDGQHRCLALKLVLGDDADEWPIEADVYEGLTEEEEAEMFLSLNNTKTVSAFDKFKVSVTAGREEESDVNRIVRSHGLRVSQNGKQGSIGATSALMNVYRLGGPKLLSATLYVMSSAWESTVWDSFIIKGMALFLNRYGDRVDKAALIKKMSALPMANKSLKIASERIRLSSGTSKDKSCAAAITDEYNKGRRGVKSLGSWFKNTGKEDSDA
ncbi:DUF6551 family protein [Bifidobacterium olomucense]|uniref:Phage protein n=1 Tax=Bifidobacterium olomucense TaxID=2675324 RepID=A0A7Y0HXJ6_9BIFI|nr:DUF6551 family protein [Bifidobacterium sp. DSM 109959]NMM98089.1 phage protein [Bifidobacterium sp. DSM 109959]